MTLFEQEIAELMIEVLSLERTPDSIDPAASLYGEGLGLDSIDVLEVALAMSTRFGIQLKSGSEDNYRIFSSLRTLAAYVDEQRAQ